MRFRVTSLLSLPAPPASTRDGRGIRSLGARCSRLASTLSRQAHHSGVCGAVIGLPGTSSAPLVNGHLFVLLVIETFLGARPPAVAARLVNPAHRRVARTGGLCACCLPVRGLLAEPILARATSSSPWPPLTGSRDPDATGPRPERM